VHRLPVRPLAGSLLAAATALALTGCAMTFNARSLGVPVTMSAAAGQPVPGDSFTVTVRAVHLLWGLAGGGPPPLQAVLASQLGAGGGVANLEIHSRKRWSDVLITALTGGVVSPTSVTYSGVITRAAP
jgi:hypothetical protein